MVDVVRLDRDKAPGGEKVRRMIPVNEKQNEYAHENIHRGKRDRQVANGDHGSFSAPGANVSQEQWDKIFKKS